MALLPTPRTPSCMVSPNPFTSPASPSLNYQSNGTHLPRLPSYHSHTPHSPICSRSVPEQDINTHLDNNCSSGATRGSTSTDPKPKPTQAVAPIFNKQPAQKTLAAKDTASSRVASASFVPKKRSATTLGNADAGPSKRPKGQSKLAAAAPLAERLRPQTLDEFVGQPHLTRPNSLLMNLVRTGSIGSLILWGPPGYVPPLMSPATSCPILRCPQVRQDDAGTSACQSHRRRVQRAQCHRLWHCGHSRRGRGSQRTDEPDRKVLTESIHVRPYLTTRQANHSVP